MATVKSSPVSEYPPLKSDRRQRRSAEIRERLFRSALALFAKKGFAETTVQDITEAADLGKGTFFNHFPSKDHILIAFSDMQVAKLDEMVSEMRDSNPPVRAFLGQLTTKMTEEPARAPSLVRALLQANLSSSNVRDVMKENHARGLKLLTQMAEMAQERGEFRQDVPASELANVFRQTVMGTLLVWSVYADASLPERMRSALDVLWGGLALSNDARAPRVNKESCS
jgi:AcrR family transcriptional regulator